jgi:hypothetical protein
MPNFDKAGPIGKGRRDGSGKGKQLNRVGKGLNRLSEGLGKQQGAKKGEC